MKIDVGQVYWHEVYYPKLRKSEIRPVVILEIEDGSPIFATFSTITSQGISDFDEKYDKWKVPIFKWKECNLNKSSYVKSNCVAQTESTAFHRKDYIGQMDRNDFKQVFNKVYEFIESGEEPW